jgi:dynactin 1
MVSVAEWRLLTVSEEYEKPVAGLEGERSSLAFVQLEKHNERLKEALIR